MSTLGDLRAELLSSLSPVGQTYTYVPARIVPPALVVLPGSPYVTPGDVFGTFDVHHSVSIIVATGTNEEVTSTMDDQIEATLNALVAAGVRVESCSSFYAYDAGSTQYLAADIQTIDNVHL